ncbi:hypothetical protein MC7420_47 [Coleofasciculus chthonoplastes PCC 7420]|uniref:Uncharacterized protein n=1 Tax=Coleofasciculus chthonoplastes PCC 7420 TaxID=118168 RepID=B4W2Y1_9CYAN|nr:hypothetical protein MC7420_47 [Coleofasciculus chthonoplastes PCC 7420]
MDRRLPESTLAEVISPSTTFYRCQSPTATQVLARSTVLKI